MTPTVSKSIPFVLDPATADPLEKAPPLLMFKFTGAPPYGYVDDAGLISPIVI